MGCTASSQTVSQPGQPAPKARAVIEQVEDLASFESEASMDLSGFFGKYELSEKLGKGGFAQVRALSDDNLAVKVQDLRTASDSGPLVESAKLRRSAVREVTAWEAVGKHTNVVSLHDSFFENGVSFFVMDRCDVTFQKYLSNGAGAAAFDERAMSRIFRQLLEGLAHIHSCRVVHRDLKPDNVMVSDSDVCKLCDFGLATVLPEDGSGLKGTYGTAPYMSPEMLKEKHYKTESDVWSLGVMAYLFLYGRFPYEPEVKSAKEMKNVIREGSVLPSFTPALRQRDAKPLPQPTRDAENFVRQLLSREQHERISAADAGMLVFVAEGPAEDVELQCLMPTLCSAMTAGAFENRNVDKKDGTLDPLLERWHRTRTGSDLSEASMSRSSSPKKGNRRPSGSDMSTACGTSSRGTSSAQLRGKPSLMLPIAARA